MDVSLLTPEVVKANNPGINDFGSGNIIALTSQCLRATSKPTACTICVDFCPANAIDTKLTGRPRINTDCIKCGACIGTCPTNALASSKKTLHQITRLALTATLRVKHLALTCERTQAILRLATLDSQEDGEKSDLPLKQEAPRDVAEHEQEIPPRAAEHEQKAARSALDLIRSAVASEHVMEVPCLGMIPREIWFAILNEIGISRLEALSVFLPPGLCSGCPTNAKDNVEDLFGEAITTAEIWAEQSVGIITDPRELPQEHRANVRTYLTSELEMDRRGAFTGFLKELKDTWEENSQVGNKAQEEVRIQRERKATFERTRLSSALKEQKPGSKKPIDVPTRRILIEALGRNAAHASEVSLTISTTNAKDCTLCGTCVLVCPLHARKIDEKVVVNELYCVGCSACIQACPVDACSFTEIKGSSYLND